jgi:hypothetical protein
MYDPLNGIALVRSLTRPGGIVIVETMAMLSNKMTGYFNAAGYLIRDQHNYWNLSITLLCSIICFDIFDLSQSIVVSLKAPAIMPMMARPPSVSASRAGP